MSALPGNISSMIRRLPDLDGKPFLVDRANGASLTDIHGRRYVDLAMSMGATILGHAHPAVVEACTRALERGSMPGFSHELEAAAADAMVKDAGKLTRATFVTTGSEAVHLACRIARKTTGRHTIAKIAAGFDGWYDDLAFGWSGSPEADLAGKRPFANGFTLLRWNDVADLEALFAESKDIAAVLIEPMLANAGSLMAEPEYLEAVGRICRNHGAMVISDEVLMGLRLHPGPTCHRLGLDPDLVTLGKAIGSGVPVAAVLGTEEAFTAVIDGRATRAGTYHGNPLVASAVLATFETLRKSDYAAFLQRGEDLRRAISGAFTSAGIKVATSGIGSVFSLWFADRSPTRYGEAKSLIRAEFSAALHLELRRQGVVTIPSPWGRIFTSFAHGPADHAAVVDAYRQAAAKLAAGSAGAK
jgi:glutamate-1-semialdehyde 2,1-aminomutase